MKKTLKKRLPLFLLLLLLVWGVWYTRPVGVETLFPDMEPEFIDVYLSSFQNRIHKDRNLKLESGTVEFETLWEEVQGLRFRRSLFNPVKQALPFLDGLTRQAKRFENDDITDMLIALVQDNGQEVWRSEQLRLWVDSWTYEDWDHDVTLTLWMKDGKTVGQDLAHRLWEMAAE